LADALYLSIDNDARATSEQLETAVFIERTGLLDWKHQVTTGSIRLREGGHLDRTAAREDPIRPLHVRHDDTALIDVHIFSEAADGSIGRLDKEVSRDFYELAVVPLSLLDDVSGHATDNFHCAEHGDLELHEGALLLAFVLPLPPDLQREVGVCRSERKAAVRRRADLEAGFLVFD
jgi:hypothetical protein